MQVGYVVLYVNDAEACRRFWVEQVGMVAKGRSEAGGFTTAQVGFADQPFAFELVPLALMQDNPDGLDLATPSICFQVDDLEAAHVAERVALDEITRSALEAPGALVSRQDALAIRDVSQDIDAPALAFLLIFRGGDFQQYGMPVLVQTGHLLAEQVWLARGPIGLAVAFVFTTIGFGHYPPDVVPS